MRVNEIFHSLQGEGFHSGTPAVFLRLSGCNLKCPFCDTLHEEYTEMDEAEIVAEAGRFPSPLTVVTGGEPALQLTASLVDGLHSIGKRVAVETNGTLQLPDNVDWITLSPKDLFLGEKAAIKLHYADELKVVFDGEHDPEVYASFNARHRFLQPCDTGDPERNAAIARKTVQYCMEHPAWRLSMQIHKTLNIR